MIVVAVPAKDLHHAKQRLAEVLSPAERAALARAMLHDVLGALTVARVDEVWIVTVDAAVKAIAATFGARVVTEDQDRGHTAAARHAQDAARRAGASVFVTVPGDVPCITPSEVDALVAATARAPAAAFAPSRSGIGTNGAALAPPDVVPLRFGEPSFEDHVAAARTAGLVPTVLHLPGLALDIDGPDDLAALRHDERQTEAGRLVRAWALEGRLVGHGAGERR
jgi:2-phospho-L-lactate guanylyltransferase